MVVIIEPECLGFMHEEVNAGMLYLLTHVFTEMGEICFLAEKEHAQCVNLVLQRKHVALNKTDIAIQPFNPVLTMSERRKFDKQVLGEVIGTKNDISNLIFLSCTVSSLNWIKDYLRSHPEVRGYVALHGILESAIRKPTTTLRDLDAVRNWFGWELLLRNPKNLSYFVFGKNILQNIKSFFPWITKRCISVNMPYFFSAQPAKSRDQKHRTILGTMGTMGRGRGLDLLAQLVVDLKNAVDDTAFEFHCVGHINDKGWHGKIDEKVIFPSKDKPLERTAFIEHGKRLDYVVFFYSPRSYKLSTSAALFDAIELEKPIIVLANDCFSYYFENFGDIGYMCADYQELKKTVIELVASPNWERYDRQRACIKKIKTKIDLGTTVSELKEKITPIK